MSTASPQTPGNLQPGVLIAGKYRVERTIAAGGMGVVLAAKHDTLGNPVAIKVMLPQALSEEGAQDRFLREARAAAHITSEHVVRVFDVGTLDDGLPFMAMELLAGRDLSAILQARGPLPVAEAAGYLLQAAEGLIEAHRHGVVHRDLKPANLFVLDRGGRLKILDFGISKILSPDGPLSAEGAVRTSTQALMGSPMYMSPEQVRSTKNVDLSTDIWAIGVIFFELVTGKMLFEAESVGAVFARILTDRIPVVLKARSDLPKAAAAVIARCLDREPEKRPTAAQLRKLLAPLASSSARDIVRSPRSSPSGASPESLGESSLAGSVNDATGARRIGASRRAPIALATFALVALAAIGGYFVTRGGATAGPDPSQGGPAQGSPASTTPTSAVTVSLGTVVPPPPAPSDVPTASGAPVNTVYPTAAPTGTRTTKTTTTAGGKPPRGINLNTRD